MVFWTFHFFIYFLNGVDFSILKCGAGTDFKRVAPDVLAFFFFHCCRCSLYEFLCNRNSEGEFFDFDYNNFSFMDAAFMVFIS